MKSHSCNAELCLFHVKCTNCFISSTTFQEQTSNCKVGIKHKDSQQTSDSITAMLYTPVPSTPGIPAGNCFSWQTKTIQNRWIKGIKLITNSPYLGGSYRTQHSIISFTSCQGEHEKFFDLLLSRQSIIFTWSLAKIKQQMYPISLYAFSSFSHIDHWTRYSTFHLICPTTSNKSVVLRSHFEN